MLELLVVAWAGVRTVGLRLARRRAARRYRRQRTVGLRLAVHGDERWGDERSRSRRGELVERRCACGARAVQTAGQQRGSRWWRGPLSRGYVVTAQLRLRVEQALAARPGLLAQSSSSWLLLAARRQRVVGRALWARGVTRDGSWLAWPWLLKLSCCVATEKLGVVDAACVATAQLARVELVGTEHGCRGGVGVVDS